MEKLEKDFKEFITTHIKPSFKESMLTGKTIREITDETIMEWSRICFEAGAKSQNK